MSELTEEQRERIRYNRERALEIQKERQQQLEHEQQRQLREMIKHQSTAISGSTGNGGGTTKRPSESKTMPSDVEIKKKPRTSPGNRIESGDQILQGQSQAAIATVSTSEDVDLEDFEIGASKYVTKQDAMSLYCLPAGTLAICTCVEEKPNPRNKAWAPIKLYSRSEIRQWAHKRFGSREGLQAERKLRADKRLSKDLDKAQDFFK